MRRKPLTRSAVCFLIAVFALGSLAEAGPAVLCVGEDGHTDIEYSLSGCCSFEFDDSAQPGADESISRLPECDDCVDLGLEQRSLKKDEKLLPVPRADVSGIRQLEAPVSEFVKTETPRYSSHDSLSPLLSSIVLLT